METLRLHRPRILIHGPPGMGQTYLGAAALHHLEGFHIQSLDLGSLLSDSTRVSV
jgi:ATPase family AAA domain-containing protein 2